MAKEPAGTTQQTLAPLPETFRSPRSAARPRSLVLIAEDDTDLACSYQRALEAYGYIVDRCSRADLPARLSSDRSYDVVVGDVGLDDDVALRSLRNRCPVVLLSHGLAFASALAAVRCGAYRYLLKPVSDERLLEVLVETIRETSARSQ